MRGHGRCVCGEVSYRLERKPLFVHCCHCTWCQRETGSAFVLNALIESRFVTLLTGAPELTNMPSASGKGQQIFRCPSCRVALWSVYSGLGDKIRFVRVGTLEDAAACPPDIHIFTSTKLPWVILGSEVPVVEEYYRRSEYWPVDSLERREAEMARTD